MKSSLQTIISSRLIFGFMALVSPVVRAHPARVIFDPEKDYVASRAYPNDLKPAGDDVLRLDLDLDGNGIRVVFLSYRSFTSRSGHTWTAYTPVNGGGYQRVDNTQDGNLIQFREGFYFAGKIKGIAEKGGLTVLYPGKGGANAVVYTIRDGQAATRQLPPIDYAYKAAKKKWLEGILMWKKDESGEFSPDYTKDPKVLFALKIRSGG